MTSISGTVNVVLRAARGGRGYGQGPRGTPWLVGREGRGEKREGLDSYLLQFTGCKQLSLPIRLSFMFSFGLFLVA